MFALLSILSWLAAIAGGGAIICTLIFTDYGKKCLVYIFIPIAGIIGVWSSWLAEENYYTKYGNPYVVYAQVQAISDNRITLYAGRTAGNGNTTDIFIKSKADFKRLHEEDIVRLTYFNGFYHNFTIKVDRLVLEK